MNTELAIMMGELNRGKEMMVFDWDKAATIIREKKPFDAFAGLENDLEWTGGTIYKDGNIVQDSYTYLSSTWATPILILDGDYENAIACFIMEHQTSWGSDTIWPESAVHILKEGTTDG
jgi:hypothetical protein